MCLLFINFGFHLVFFLIIVCRRVTADDTLSLLALLKFLTIKSLNRNLKIAFYEERYILLAVKVLLDICTVDSIKMYLKRSYQLCQIFPKI